MPEFLECARGVMRPICDPKRPFVLVWLSANSCPNADLHDAGDNVSLLGKEHLDPINYSAHAGRAAQITVDNDPVFGSDFWDRRGQSFKQRMAVSHITGQHAAPSTG